ncbi:MAG: cytidylate kinase family protein [Proteobacteria bacterium]|nr:cytidylate kinase family protein [Pseudomonadota bacterium]MBU1386729.1 cytidylate kinase family protein [Pseudomonadota bacterium]MBU1544377.1 cytidylate kinase family protein [Pseudomonadota bacterium]
MTIINISRQPYSDGDEIAEEIARNLNYKLIDKLSINRKVKDFHSDLSDELKDLAEEKEPGFFKHFFKNPEVYNDLIQAILFEEASNDNVVIEGRGGQYFLDQNHVLNVRIIAPFEYRCANLARHRKLNQEMAEKILEKIDHDQEHFIKYLFKKDSSDPQSYDLIFNHYKFDTDIIVSTIISYAQLIQNKCPLTDADKDFFKRMSLEKRIEATIKKEMPESVHIKVECKKLGAIKISGFVFDEIESNKIFKLAHQCDGVDSIENNLDTSKLHKT